VNPATLLAEFAWTMEVAAYHYQLDDHVEPPLGPGEVRAIVLTLGTLTVVRLDASSAPVHASSSYRCLRPDVLIAAVACWQNDRPEGFLIRAIFRTRHQGQPPPAEVEARIYAQVAWLERAKLLPEDSFNGVQFDFGSEMDLQFHGELVRMLGGPRDDLS
jgi:hypothetical protein